MVVMVRWLLVMGRRVGGRRVRVRVGMRVLEVRLGRRAQAEAGVSRWRWCLGRDERANVVEVTSVAITALMFTFTITFAFTITITVASAFAVLLAVAARRRL